MSTDHQPLLAVPVRGWAVRMPATSSGQIRTALHTVLREGTTVTRDLGGTASTTAFTDAIIRAMAS